MTLLRLDVDGMGCLDCVRKLTARLRDVPGVETVTADHRRSVVVLVGSMSHSAVLSALEGTRFRVARISPPDGPESDGTEGGQHTPEPSGPQPPLGGPTSTKGAS